MLIVVSPSYAMVSIKLLKEHTVCTVNSALEGESIETEKKALTLRKFDLCGVKNNRIGLYSTSQKKRLN